MTTVDLQGVALRTHDEPYPFDYDPYGHQIDLIELFDQKSSFIAVNDSPTGGGKTSSWLAPACRHRIDTVAVYPTNALIEDQKRGIEDETDSFDDVAVLKVTSDTLSKKRREYGVGSNAKTIDQWLREYRDETVLFLTNPDIFVMMCRGLYAKPNRSYKRFELAVVDEFHRAGLKERNTLRYLLDELLERKSTRLRRVVFLSATPDAAQEATFERAMSVPYYRLPENSDENRRSFRGPLGDGWRPVMPPVDLDIRPASTFNTANALLENDAESTLEFCRGGRTVLMLDGIHEVEQVFEWLTDDLDCRVERIDGFHDRNKREKLERFDVLVSNSAVEVGIDFEVDRILFAGHSKDSFLQRLGRLRTESDVRRARCYVPENVSREMTALDSESLSRTELRQKLKSVYSDSRTPDTFDWRYSAQEALDHLRNRLRNVTTGATDDVQQRGVKRIHRHFLADYDDVTFADVKRMQGTVDWEILRDLQWYRGDSVQALVWDTTTETLRTYDLFYLLRHGDVEFHDRDTFERIVADDAVEKISHDARYVDGFCTYYGGIETTDDGYGRNVAFTGGSLGGWIANSRDDTRKPQVRDGLKVTVDSTGLKPVRNDSVDDELNQRLKNRSERMGRPDEDDGGLLCYPVRGTSNVVKNTYDLGPFFFLYPIALPNTDEYSLAVGTDALYLHCHVQERQAGGLLIDT